MDGWVSCHVSYAHVYYVYVDADDDISINNGAFSGLDTMHCRSVDTL